VVAGCSCRRKVAPVRSPHAATGAYHLARRLSTPGSVLRLLRAVIDGYALEPGFRFTPLHRQAELGFGSTTTGCFNAEGRELALGWTRQALTVRLVVLEHQKCDRDQFPRLSNRGDVVILSLLNTAEKDSERARMLGHLPGSLGK